jgi:hypothetical protein
MTQLNQIVALEKGVKSRAYADFTAAHRVVQKAPLLSGISRSYRPKDDEGEQLPSESTKVQIQVADVLHRVQASLTRMFDVVLTKDVANGTAKADIVVGEQTIATAVPVTYLLFLEKQLTDLHTFVSKLPVLDPAESWEYDTVTGSYTTTPSSTTRTKKVPRNHVKAEATDRHPAQVEMYYEDILVGYWTTVKLSGALPQAEVTRLVERVVSLQEAVKVAREQANSAVVTDQKIGDKVFGYLFG